MNQRIKLTLALPVLLWAMAMQGCGPSNLHDLNVALNKVAVSLNSAAKTNHGFYESGVYGTVGSDPAIRVRQRGATAIHTANDKLIVALDLAKQLRPETFEQGKLAVLQALAEAGASLHTGNTHIDLVLQAVALLINQAVVLIEAFKSADLRYVLPRIQSWQLPEVVV